MKRQRVVLLVSVSAALLGVAYYWSRGRPEGFATPAECLEAYREAGLAGDGPGCRRCLGEPLRTEQQRRRSTDQLRRDLQGIKSWTQLDAVVERSTARIDVDQIWQTGARRLRFHFRRSGTGWLIVRIDPPQQLRTRIPYGAPVD